MCFEEGHAPTGSCVVASAQSGQFQHSQNRRSQIMAFEGSTFEVSRTAISKSVLYRDLKYVFVGEACTRASNRQRRWISAPSSVSLAALREASPNLSCNTVLYMLQFSLRSVSRRV